jgi:hypothetical protein
LFYSFDDVLTSIKESIDKRDMIGEGKVQGRSLSSSLPCDTIRASTEDAMALVEWQIEGMELVNCNCNPGCPCQFNSLPTHGHCRAHIWVHVERGHFGDVKLDDTRFGVMAAWPGAIHQGNGTHQVIVDDRTTPEQRQALETIAKGKETEPGKVIWFIYASMSTTFLPTLTERIDLTMDSDAREARVVAGVVEGTVSPIRNAVTGMASRARVTLPMGIEFTEAEIATGTAKSTGPIEIDFTKTHAHFARFNWSTHGVIR